MQMHDTKVKVTLHVRLIRGGLESRGGWNLFAENIQSIYNIHKHADETNQTWQHTIWGALRRPSSVFGILSFFFVCHCVYIVNVLYIFRI